MASFMFVSCLLLAFLASIVHATLTKVVRDDFAPAITYPSAGVVWTVGTTQKVTWDTSVIPSGESSKTAEILLGWLDITGENLQLNNPLANITFGDGSVSVIVPNVPERDNYFLCMFGNTADITRTFTIKGGQGSASSPSWAGPSTVTSTQGGPSTVTVVSTKSGPLTVMISSLSTLSSSLSSSSSVSLTLTSSTSSSSPTRPVATTSSAASAVFGPKNQLFSVLTISFVAFFM